MPLASLANLQWNGPASSASRVEAAASSSIGIKGYGRANGASTGVASVPLAKATRLRNRPATLAATASITSALPKGRAKPSATIEVNKLSQDDVTGAVLEAQIEDGFTLRQVLQILAAVAAGKTDIIPLGGTLATVKFRDLNDTRDAVVADMDSSERTSITINN